MARFNFEGWNFKEWIKGNATTIKEFLKVGVPFIASTFFTSELTINFISTIVGKFLLDCLDYYISK